MKKKLSEHQRFIIEAATEKKAFDILLLDVRNRTDLADYLIICSGNSRVQVQAIVDAILEKTRGTPHEPSAMEGYGAGNWVILDMVDILVHVFQKDTRSFYDLERLWGDVPVIEAAVI